MAEMLMVDFTRGKSRFTPDWRFMGKDNLSLAIWMPSREGWLYVELDSPDEMHRGSPEGAELCFHGGFTEASLVLAAEDRILGRQVRDKLLRPRVVEIGDRLIYLYDYESDSYFMLSVSDSVLKRMANTELRQKPPKE